jgi:hypothetical protein
LAMVMGEYRFSCCVLDFRRNRFLGLHHFLQEDPAVRVYDFQGLFRQVLTTLPWMKLPFRMVKAAFDGEKATLVPSMLYIPDDPGSYLAYNHRLEAGDIVSQDHLMPLDAWQIFAVPGALAEEAAACFPGIRLAHSMSLLIESIWINFKNRIKTTHIFLHFRDPFFDLMVFDGRKMDYVNVFRFQAPEEVLYYVIFVMEQLALNPETVPVVLLGEVEESQAIQELIFKYIRYVSFARRNDAYHYSYTLNQVPEHFHFPLLNFFSCAL